MELRKPEAWKHQKFGNKSPDGAALLAEGPGRGIPRKTELETEAATHLTERTVATTPPPPAKDGERHLQVTESMSLHRDWQRNRRDPSGGYRGERGACTHPEDV